MKSYLFNTSNTFSLLIDNSIIQTLVKNQMSWAYLLYSIISDTLESCPGMVSAKPNVGKIVKIINQLAIINNFNNELYNYAKEAFISFLTYHTVITNTFIIIVKLTVLFVTIVANRTRHG